MSAEVQATLSSMSVKKRKRASGKYWGQGLGLVRTGFEGMEERMGASEV